MFVANLINVFVISKKFVGLITPQKKMKKTIGKINWKRKVSLVTSTIACQDSIIAFHKKGKWEKKTLVTKPDLLSFKWWRKRYIGGFFIF